MESSASTPLSKERAHGPAAFVVALKKKTEFDKSAISGRQWNHDAWRDIRSSTARDSVHPPAWSSSERAICYL